MNGNYKLLFRSRTYEIPKYSIGIRRMMDQIDSENSDAKVDREQKYRNMYDFIKELIGEENARDAFGTDDFEQVDLNDITIAYLGVASAYDKPVNDEKKKTAAGSISKEDRELIQSIQTIMQNAGTLQKLNAAANAGNQNLRVLR